MVRFAKYLALDSNDSLSGSRSISPGFASTASSSTPTPSNSDVPSSKGISVVSSSGGSFQNEKCGASSASSGGQDRSLKPSYIVLDDHISANDAIMLLGRVVGNVRAPLANYAPALKAIGRSALLPETHVSGHSTQGDDSNSSQSFRGLVGEHDMHSLSRGLERQSLARSQEGFKSSNRAYQQNYAEEGGAFESRDFSKDVSASEYVLDVLDVDPAIFVFHNLPLTLSESTSATLSHSMHYTKQTTSLLMSLLGLTLTSSHSTTSIFHLESKLIRTVSLTQHHLIWKALLDTPDYKKQIMSAVRDVGDGRGFLVVGVKIARDARVERSEEGKRLAKTQIQLSADVGLGTGVQGIVGGKISLNESGEKSNVGERLKRERVGGDRAFAVEYREVRLKVKLQMGTKETNKKGKGNRANNEQLFQQSAEYYQQLQEQLQKQAKELETLKAQQTAIGEALQNQRFLPRTCSPCRPNEINPGPRIAQSEELEEVARREAVEEVAVIVSENKQLDARQQEIDEVLQAIRENITRVLERGEKLTDARFEMIRQQDMGQFKRKAENKASLSWLGYLFKMLGLKGQTPSATSPAPMTEDLAPCSAPMTEDLVPCSAPMTEDLAPCSAPMTEDLAPCSAPMTEDLAPCPAPMTEDPAPCPGPVLQWDYDIVPCPVPALQCDSDVIEPPQPQAERRHMQSGTLRHGEVDSSCEGQTKRTQFLQDPKDDDVLDTFVQEDELDENEIDCYELELGDEVYVQELDTLW